MADGYALGDIEVDQRNREVILRLLGPLVGTLLLEDDVTDIILNDDCQLWVTRLGQPSRIVGVMDTYDADSLICAQADALGFVATRQTPIIQGELLIDGSRFIGIRPPVVKNPIFCIRKKASALFSLGQYVERGIMTPKQQRIINRSVRNRSNILVVGGTGSGKTTLVNGIILTIVESCPDQRIIGIEDTTELQCQAENSTFMRTTDSGINLQSLLQASLRMFPDRIIVGEVRGPEALDMLMAWNTGHPGGVCTLHSNITRPRAALQRLETLVSMSDHAPKRGIEKIIGEAVDLIVCIERVPGGRRISSIHAVVEYDGKSEDYKLVPEELINPDDEE